MSESEHDEHPHEEEEDSHEHEKEAEEEDDHHHDPHSEEDDPQINNVTIKGHDILGRSDSNISSNLRSTRLDSDGPYEYKELDPSKYLFQSEDIHLLSTAPSSIGISDIV